MKAINHTTKLIFSAVLCGAAVLVSGCGTWQAKSQDVVSQATSVIEAANAAGAAKYAPETMQSANNYLSLAKQALGDGRYDNVQRFAEQAIADGQLAKLQATTGKRNEDIAALRQEIAGLTP